MTNEEMADAVARARDLIDAQAAEITRLKAVIARVHRFALAGDGAGYDLILSVTDPIVGREATQTGGEGHD